MSDRIHNIRFAGLGGQGVLKASDVCAEAAFRAGHDVKKAEVHGMSQRGGGLTSDVRYGPRVLSPMIPDGEAEVLVVLAADQVEANRHHLKPGGVLLTPSDLPLERLEHPKSLNMAMLGLLSRRLDLPEAVWIEALRAQLPAPLHAANERAFALGREIGRAGGKTETKTPRT